MKTIRNWSAERSGPTMTVKGWDEQGERVKITNVAEIVSGKDGAVATTKEGEDSPAVSYLLAVGPAA